MIIAAARLKASYIGFSVTIIVEDGLPILRMKYYENI
jgi:hypothetical protein